MREKDGSRFPRRPSLPAALSCNCQSLTSAAGCRLAWAPHGGAWLGAQLGVPHRLSSPRSPQPQCCNAEKTASAKNPPENCLSLPLKNIQTYNGCVPFIRHVDAALQACQGEDQIPSLAVLSATVCVWHPFWTHTHRLSLSRSLCLSDHCAHHTHTARTHGTSQISCKGPHAAYYMPQHVDMQHGPEYWTQRQDWKCHRPLRQHWRHHPLPLSHMALQHTVS